MKSKLQNLSLVLAIAGFAVGPAMFFIKQTLILQQTFILAIYAFVHAASLFGIKGAMIHLGITLILSSLIEIIGINTGLIFGEYKFVTEDFGFKVLNLPIGVPVAWTIWFYQMFILSKLVTGDHPIPSFTRRRSLFRRIACTLISSFIYTGLNSLSDPLYSSCGGTHFMFPQIWIWNQDKEFPVSSSSSNFKMELAQDILKQKEVTLPILSGEPITRYFRDPEIYYNHFGVPLQNSLGWFFATSLIYFVLYSLEDFELVQKKTTQASQRISHLDALPVYYFLVCGIMFGLTPQAPMTIRMFSFFLFLPLTLVAVDKLINQEKPKSQ